MSNAARAALLPYEEALQTRGYDTRRSSGTYGITESIKTYSSNGELQFSVVAGVDEKLVTMAGVYTVHSPRGDARLTVKSISDPTVEEALALFASFEEDVE